MKASLAIEAIGHNTAQMMRVWSRIYSSCGVSGKKVIGSLRGYIRWGVEEIDTEGNHIQWLRGRTDYSRANSKGSRGVYIWYVLESGHRYRVHAPQSWNSTEVYICTVDEEGNIVKEQE